jgi:hypothetical protein
MNIKNDPLVWEHQYANYLNGLVDELMENEEVSKLGVNQMNDLINCLPNIRIEKEYEGNYIWSVSKW